MEKCVNGRQQRELHIEGNYIRKRGRHGGEICTYGRRYLWMGRQLRGGKYTWKEGTCEGKYTYAQRELTWGRAFLSSPI